MSRASHTPIPFWLDMPIVRLFRWIKSANEVSREDDAEWKKLNGKK
nr:hypothetical protein [uncultured Marvinbryantia sp.]